MRYKELVSELAGRTGWALDDVEGMLSALGLEISSRLVEGNTVSFPGLGQFVAEKELEHILVEANGKRFLIPPKLKPVFKSAEKGKNGENGQALKELATAIAIHAGKNKESAEQFLQAFFALVAEAIRLGKDVDVKGLGIFQSVLSEEKFGFASAQEFETAVNKPFSFFEATELKEGIHFPDLEKTIRQTPELTPEVLETSEESPKKEEIEILEEPEERDEAPEEIPQPIVEKKEGEVGKRYPWWGIALLFIVVLGVSIYGILSFENKEAEIVQLFVQDSVSLLPDTLRVETSDTSSGVSEKVESPKEIGKDTIAPGDMLTTIALKYYGHKIFWVYLFEYNKEKVKDPNNIPIGTEIHIPSRELYDIDPQKAESREKAARLQTAILTKNK